MADLTIKLSTADDALTRARNILRAAGFVNPDMDGISARAADMVREYLRIDQQKFYVEHHRARVNRELMDIDESRDHR